MGRSSPVATREPKLSPVPSVAFSDVQDTDSGTKHRDKRHKASTGHIEPEALAATALRNPVDALDLLVMAADSREDGDPNHQATSGIGEISSRSSDYSSAPATSRAQAIEPLAPPTARLTDFPLIKDDVLTAAELRELVDCFLQRTHFIFPMLRIIAFPEQSCSLPSSPETELHLCTAMVVIASRHNVSSVHDKSWFVYAGAWGLAS